MSHDSCEESCACEDSAAMAAFYDYSEAAFEALATRWRPRLFGFFRRVGMRVEDAEDLAETILVKLYATKDRQGFDFSRPLAPYMFSMARNEYKGWLREQDRRPKVVPLIEALDLATHAEDPHPTLSADLTQCIEGLPRIEKHYVLHCGKHGLGDMSHGEIAAALDKWPGQITQISKSARALLAVCLKGKGY